MKESEENREPYYSDADIERIITNTFRKINGNIDNEDNRLLPRLRRNASIIILLGQLALMLVGIGVVWGASKTALSDITELKLEVKKLTDQDVSFQLLEQKFYSNSDRLDKIEDRILIRLDEIDSRMDLLHPRN